MLKRRVLWVAAMLFSAACSSCGGGGGGGGGAAVTTTPPVVTPPIIVDPPPTTTGSLAVLMMGNSHTAVNDLPAMLAAMLRAGRPGKTVEVVNAPGIQFIDERLKDAETQRLFNSRKWQAVIFQAQQYSLSGQFTYSTEEAVEWVRLARTQQSVPVMFPEWPRLGIDETQRIYDLHVGIAQRQPACVAPIPQAFDLAKRRTPDLVLHAADGNHSAPPGAFLAALVLYGTVTGNAPLGLPALSPFNVDAATQARLRAVADEQLKLINGRQYCPNDVLL